MLGFFKKYPLDGVKLFFLFFPLFFLSTVLNKSFSSSDSLEDEEPIQEPKSDKLSLTSDIIAWIL